MHQCNHGEKKGITLAAAEINFREKLLGTWQKAHGCIQFQGFPKYKIVSISILTSKDTIISIGHESFGLISGNMYIKKVNTMFAQVVELIF